MTCKQTLHYLGPFVLMVGVAAIGLLAGYFVGLSEGQNASTVSAIIPGLLGVIGAVIGLYPLGNSGNRSLVVTGVVLLVIAVAILQGTLIGEKRKSYAASEALLDSIHQRAIFLKACALAETAHNINGFREKHGLSPLADDDISLCN